MYLLYAYTYLVMNDISLNMEGGDMTCHKRYEIREASRMLEKIRSMIWRISYSGKELRLSQHILEISAFKGEDWMGLRPSKKPVIPPIKGGATSFSSFIQIQRAITCREK